MSFDSKESDENLKALDRSNDKPVEDTGPKPIEFSAILHPGGQVQIKCALMNNPVVMRGILEIIRDATIQALAQVAEDSKPRIVQPTKNPGFLGGLRRMK
jgi:hypothetical protein